VRRFPHAASSLAHADAGGEFKHYERDPKRIGGPSVTPERGLLRGDAIRGKRLVEQVG